jgi:hypothetical protein
VEEEICNSKVEVVMKMGEAVICSSMVEEGKVMVGEVTCSSMEGVIFL